MQWLIDLQRWLYGSMAAGLKAGEDFSTLPVLLASAVLFGSVCRGSTIIWKFIGHAS